MSKNINEIRWIVLKLGGCVDKNDKIIKIYIKN
jgi:hypothetical protein